MDGFIRLSRPSPRESSLFTDLRTKAGFELKLTADHRVLTVNRGDVACL